LCRCSILSHPGAAQLGSASSVPEQRSTFIIKHDKTIAIAEAEAGHRVRPDPMDVLAMI
jgi:peroxiredoxin